eukprot:2454668-Lingulodinium_polyedra.AAC.1
MWRAATRPPCCPSPTSVRLVVQSLPATRPHKAHGPNQVQTKGSEFSLPRPATPVDSHAQVAACIGALAWAGATLPRQRHVL